VRVRDPEGRQWRVRRRWLTIRRPKWHGKDRPDLDALDVIDLGDDPISLVIGVVLLLGGGLLIALFLLPLLLFLGELLLVVLLALLGILGRLLLRRPWTIEARCGQAVVRTEVPGWQAGSREIARLARDVRMGRLA
jgi:hypothetical protein